MSRKDTWKLCKQTYKKYDTRHMKDSMSQTAKAWGKQTVVERDATIKQLRETANAALSASIVQQQEKNLNQL